MHEIYKIIKRISNPASVYIVQLLKFSRMKSLPNFECLIFRWGEICKVHPLFDSYSCFKIVY